MKLLLKLIGFASFLLVFNLVISAQANKFDGVWAIDKMIYGKNVSLSVELKQKGNKLEGSYGNASTKESSGDILSSKIQGNEAFLEISCDWGGSGTVKITRLAGNRLHWKIIKRDEKKGQLIVLIDETLKLQKKEVFFSLATPSDTFKSHYAALAANDDQLLRKTLSVGLIKLFGGLFPDKKIVETMRDILKSQGESTNMPKIVSEKIDGNNALIKWKASDGTIVYQPLLKESDGWKMGIAK